MRIESLASQFNLIGKSLLLLAKKNLNLAMKQATLSRVTLSFGLAALLLSSIVAVPVKANENRAEFPGRRVGGGTRSECLVGQQYLLALTPSNNLTVSAKRQPALFFALPRLDAAQSAKFLLIDDQDQTIYQTALTSQATAPLLKIQLPANVLQAGRDYRWQFAFACDPADRSQDIVLAGWLRTVSAQIAAVPRSDLAARLQQVKTYQEVGLSGDAIAALVELQQDYSNDAEVQQAWQKMLKTLQLDHIFVRSVAAQNLLLPNQ